MSNLSISRLINECYIDENLFNKAIEKVGRDNFLKTPIAIKGYNFQEYGEDTRKSIRIYCKIHDVLDENSNVYIGDLNIFFHEICKRSDYIERCFLECIYRGLVRGKWFDDSFNLPVPIQIKKFLHENPQKEEVVEIFNHYLRDRNLLRFYSLISPY